MGTALSTAPTAIEGASEDGRSAQAVTVTEALAALKVLRAELADLRMLVRAARKTDGVAGPAPRPERITR
jgi:hypothetical protein